LEGKATRRETMSREHFGPRAVMNALDRLMGRFSKVTEDVHKELALTESQLRDYQARVGTPFTHENYQAELAGLRDQLKARLFGAAPDQEDIDPANTTGGPHQRFEFTLPLSGRSLTVPLPVLISFSFTLLVVETMVVGLISRPSPCTSSATTPKGAFGCTTIR